MSQLRDGIQVGFVIASRLFELSHAILKARHRLCLTGTPLENHLGELWSQFDFLLPG